MELRRLGSDLFEVDIRSGTHVVGDAKVLGTLPQFQDKVATLQVLELKAAQNARATREQNVAGTTSFSVKSTDPRT